MKRLLSTLLVCVAALSGLQAQSIDDLGKIKFTGVKSIKIQDEAKDGQRYAYIRLMLSNSSTTELIIGTGEFYKIIFQVPKAPEVKPAGSDVVKDPAPETEWTDHLTLFNATPAKEARLPKGSMMSKGVGEVVVKVPLGVMSEETTTETMIPLFNLIAGGDKRIKIVLDGQLRYGASAGSATAFQTRFIRWEVEPKQTDRVLFEQ